MQGLLGLPECILVQLITRLSPLHWVGVFPVHVMLWSNPQRQSLTSCPSGFHMYYHSPSVLSQSEVAQLFRHVGILKQRAILILCYVTFED